MAKLLRNALKASIFKALMENSPVCSSSSKVRSSSDKVFSCSDQIFGTCASRHVTKDNWHLYCLRNIC